MDNSEIILKKIIKTSDFPETSAGFTSNLMKEIQSLPRHKSLPAKPIIHPVALWGGMLFVFFTTVFLFWGNESFNIQFSSLNHNIFPYYFIRNILSNYLATASFCMILLWFLIEFRLGDIRRAKLTKK